MIDVNQITSTLRGMPDQQLQKYAMMHKGDPYILSLAVSESNQRKQLRAAAQAQAAGQPMPKVADQDIAQMAPQQLPEEQGIGALPAPNMQRMADGGIAGYGDDANEGMAAGGSMFDFAQRSEPVLRMSGGGAVQKYAGKGEQLVRTTDGGKTWWLDIPAPSRGNPSPATALANKKFASKEEAIAAFDSITGGEAPAPTASAPADLVIPYGQSYATNVLGNAPSAPPAPAPTPSAAPAPQTTLSTGLPSLTQVKKMSDELYDTKGMNQMVEQQRLQQRQDITNQSEERAAKMAAFNKEQGPAFAGYEKLLKSEELQDATDKEKSGLMALMKGFLGMAAGESPNAATNIAKGAMMGLGEYSESLKEFKKAAKERNKAMADIENARRSEARGDFKSQQDYEAQASERLSKVDQHATDAVLGIMGKKGEGATNLAREMIQQSGANARTMAQVNAPGQTERIIDRMARDPKFKEEYKNYASIGPEAKGIAGIAAKMVGNPAAMMLLKQEDPALHAQVSAYIKQMALTPTSTPTGQVLVGQ